MAEASLDDGTSDMQMIREKSEELEHCRDSPSHPLEILDTERTERALTTIRLDKILVTHQKGEIRTLKQILA